MAAREQARGSKSGRKPKDELSLGTDKLYFKIGEVAEIVGVAAHVLRYWETEFSALKPSKSRTQQRVYRRRDVATLLRIKHLLYVEKFTIAGARKQLRKGADAVPMAAPDASYAARQSLGKVRAVLDELEAILEMPMDPAGADPAGYLREATSAETGPPEAGEPSRSLLERPPR